MSNSVILTALLCLAAVSSVDGSDEVATTSRLQVIVSLCTYVDGLII